LKGGTSPLSNPVSEIGHTRVGASKRGEAPLLINFPPIIIGGIKGEGLVV
jgi:hypothetical protein